MISKEYRLSQAKRCCDFLAAFLKGTPILFKEKRLDLSIHRLLTYRKKKRTRRIESKQLYDEKK